MAGTGILIIENGDEEDWITAGVDLVVDRPLGEKGTLTWCQVVFDETSTVLFDEAGLHRSAHKVKDLGCSWVGVRGVQAAWSDFGQLERDTDLRDVHGTYAI